MIIDPARTYDDVLNFLLEFTDYEKVTKYKYDIATFNLERVEDLMAAVGKPHRAFRSVHIAGTKGKGSTAAMVQSILTAAGLRTGLYTSPHLSRLEERMTVDGKLMSESELVRIINELVPYTRRARGGFAVVEVGLGGRLDATNVIVPEVVVITRVDFDHVERLGNTLGKIAAEKAGIIKPGVPVICALQQPEALGTIAAVAERHGVRLTLIGRDYTVEKIRMVAGPDGSFTSFDLSGPRRRYENLAVGLLGAHQAGNAAAAIAVAERLIEKCDLEIGEEAIRRGLGAARLPARQEFFPGEPSVLLDGAHNPISVTGLCDTLDNVFSDRRIVMILGFSRDKDVGGMLKEILPRAAAVVFTRSDSPRAEDPGVLAEMACELHAVEVETFDSPHDALTRARELARPEDLICIAGSFFLAGNLRPFMVGR